MGNVENAYVAHSIDGGVYWRAPLGTDLPTEAVKAASTLDPAFEDQGTCAQDGLTVGITRTSNQVRDFDGGVYITVQTEYSATMKVKLLDVDSEAVKKTAFGDANVVFTPGGTGVSGTWAVEHNADELPIGSHVFATKSGAKHKTYVIEKGRVSEIAEFTDQSGDATGLELTIESFRNSNGNYVEEYGDDGVVVP